MGGWDGAGEKRRQWQVGLGREEDCLVGLWSTVPLTSVIAVDIRRRATTLFKLCKVAAIAQKDVSFSWRITEQFKIGSHCQQAYTRD